MEGRRREAGSGIEKGREKGKGGMKGMVTENGDKG